MRSIVEVGTSVPAFLGKLWKLVNDSETDHLISWSPGGKTFFIKNQAEFARSLLPQYYKHNNMASFIRQLNMYGFHKITSVENGGLRYEKDEMEFSHPCFQKGHAYLLEHIKRKIANPKSIITSNDSGEQVLVKPEIMNKVLTEVKQMKGKQESMDAKFSVMKQENEALWREVALLRQKHIKQQQIVNNHTRPALVYLDMKAKCGKIACQVVRRYQLIQFLMSLVQPSRGTNMNAHGVKRRYQLMINDQAHDARLHQPYPNNPKLEADLLDDLNEEALEEGPIIHELAHDDLAPPEQNPSAIDPNEYVTIEWPNISTQPRPGSSDGYHVTMVEGDDSDAVGAYQINDQINNSPSPIVTSPSDFNVMSPAMSKGKIGDVPGASRNLTSPSQFTISPAIDTRLPAEIFASDDSVSDAGIPMTEHQILNVKSSVATRDNSLVSKDMLLTNAENPLSAFLQPQPVSVKVEKPTGMSRRSNKKTAQEQIGQINLANIKTEQPDSDWNVWNNMTLATVNNNGNLPRVQTMNLRDIFNNNEDRTSKFGSSGNKTDLDDHLDSMQSDLDSLRELLRGDSYTFDANTLLGVSNTATNLFGQEDPLYGLNVNNVEDKTKENPNGQETNQLMSYTGNMPDFGDFSLVADSDVAQEEVVPDSDPLLAETSSLNTPQVTLQSPFYPSINN